LGGDGKGFEFDGGEILNTEIFEFRNKILVGALILDDSLLEQIAKPYRYQSAVNYFKLVWHSLG